MQDDLTLKTQVARWGQKIQKECSIACNYVIETIRQKSLQRCKNIEKAKSGKKQSKAVKESPA